MQLSGTVIERGQNQQSNNFPLNLSVTGLILLWSNSLVYPRMGSTTYIGVRIPTCLGRSIHFQDVFFNSGVHLTISVTFQQISIFYLVSLPIHSAMAGNEEVEVSRFYDSRADTYDDGFLQNPGV